MSPNYLVALLATPAAVYLYCTGATTLGLVFGGLAAVNAGLCVIELCLPAREESPDE